MPFQKGVPRPPGSGRKKGSFNLAGTVRAKLEEMQCDPIAGLISLAENKRHTAELRGHCYAKLCKFVYPELRAIEHSGMIASVNLDVTSPRELLAARIAGIADRSTTSGGDRKSE